MKRNLKLRIVPCCRICGKPDRDFPQIPGLYKCDSCRCDVCRRCVTVKRRHDLYYYYCPTCKEATHA